MNFLTKGKQEQVLVIGGGLAGSEAAWQSARQGVRVLLYEMKPIKFSPAHKNQGLAELVCSNSLRSENLASAVGLLKEELRQAGSLIMQAADATRVPAGKAHAVDRELFSQYITRKLEEHPLISIVRREITEIPAEDSPVVLSTGPLTSDALANSLRELIGTDFMAFYDSIAPIIAGDSINMDIVFRQSRYGPEGEGDYLNCPMNQDEYHRFYEALTAAEKVPLRSFEKPRYFEGCLPIEIMAERGIDTLRYGPMKPVGLTDPRTGEQPYAVVQLRAENRQETMYNMVGFQTKLKYQEQDRIFRMVPGLENAEFVRLGSIHRNTFVCAPLVIDKFLRLKVRPNILLAGQLSGVEGYVESTAMGLLAGIGAAKEIKGQAMQPPPATTAHGALIAHLTQAKPDIFQPMNVNFGLFPPLKKRMPKRKRYEAYSKRALENWSQYLKLIWTGESSISS